MGLLDYFRPSPKPEEKVVIFDRAADPDIDIYAPSLVQASRIGLTDSEAPTEQEQRTAFRGLVYRLATDRANAISRAMVRAKVSRQIGDDNFEEVEENHPWRKLYMNPNPDRSALRFWKTASLLRDLGKGAFQYVARGERNLPASLYTIYPDFGTVDAVANTRGGVGGYAFWPAGSGEFTPIAPEDMIWLRYEHPVDPYKSASLIQASAYHSDKDLYLQIYSRDMMRDGNLPPFYVSFKEALAEAQLKSYRQGFGDNYRKLGKQGSTPILGGGGEIKPVGISPDDMQYVDAAKMNKFDLAVIFGFKAAMFEEGGVVANSTELRRSWLQDSIQAEVDELCAELTHGFKVSFDAMDSDLCIKPPDVVPKDRTEQARIDEIYIRNAVTSPQMVQEREGFEPDGEFFISGGLRPLEEVLAKPDAEEDLVI